MMKRIRRNFMDSHTIKNEKELIIENKYVPYPYIYNISKDKDYNSYYSRIYSKNPTHILDIHEDDFDTYVEPLQEGLLFISRNYFYNIYNLKTNKYLFEKDNKIHVEKFYNGIAIFRDNYNVGLINRFGKILLEIENKEHKESHEITYDIIRKKGNFYVVNEYRKEVYFEIWQPIKGCQIKQIYNESYRWREAVPKLIENTKRTYSKGKKKVYQKVLIDMPFLFFECDLMDMGYTVIKRSAKEIAPDNCCKIVMLKKTVIIYIGSYYAYPT